MLESVLRHAEQRSSDGDESEVTLMNLNLLRCITLVR